MIDIYEFVKELLNCSNTLEKIEIYKKWNLKNCRIFLFDESKSNFSTELNVNVGNFEVIGMGDYKKTWVIDNNTISKDKNYIQYGKIAHYDLNILTYINNLFRNRKLQQREELTEFLNSIKFHNFVNSISTALMERYASPINNMILAETIESFVYFDSIPMDDFLEEVKPVLPIEQYDWMKEIWCESMIYLKDVKRVDQYQAVVCYVMKAFILKISDKSLENKIKEFKNYCINNLSVLLDFEITLLILYIKNDPSTVKTFEKLQIGAKNLIKKIYNTSWDLFQVRLMEQSLLSENENRDTVFLPYFVTADRGLLDAIKINPVKMIILYNGNLLPIRSYNQQDIFSETEINQINSGAKKRLERILSVNFKKEKDSLENEILALIKKYQDKK